jgi:hypothetical protein
MPDRLDRVQVTTRYRIVEISWTERDAILDELRTLESARSAVEAFKAVGASRPVQLDTEGKAAVVDAIRVIANNAGGYDKIEPELFELRNNLVDELGARA